MTTQLRPYVQQLPTSAQLWKATGIAIVIAAVLLTTIVLPAEYNIDPTRIGGALGLTTMSGTDTAAKASAPAAAAAPTTAADDPVVRRDTPFQSETMTLTLEPGKGAEIKAAMKDGDRFVFTWSAEGGPVNFDMHGERPNAGNAFTSYRKDRQQSAGHGSFVAPFAGTHGWWWSNKGDQPVTVTVTTAGYFEKLFKP